MKSLDILLSVHDIHFLWSLELLPKISSKLEDYEFSSMLKSYSTGINI